MKGLCWLWIVSSTLVLHGQVANSKRDAFLFCSVCRALVDEVNARIDDVDPNKKHKVGSFRVDPRGNQKLEEVQYATSDVHLTEVLEDVCEAMNDYAYVIMETTKRSGVVRTKSRDGKELDASNARFNPTRKETFKSYCEEIIEDNEDDMMPLFKQKDRQNLEIQLCVELAGACTEEQLVEPALKLEEKKPRPKFSSFHQLEPEDGSARPIEGVETMEDMRNKILEAAKGQGKKKAGGGDFDDDPLKDEL